MYLVTVNHLNTNSMYNKNLYRRNIELKEVVKVYLFKLIGIIHMVINFGTSGKFLTVVLHPEGVKQDNLVLSN